NVILGDDGRVRVLDFGLARAETAPERPATPIPAPTASLDTPITQHGTVMGTPRYMAPEQHRGLIAEAPADVFSLCVALYEALYRAHPFGPPEMRLGRVRSGEHDPP